MKLRALLTLAVVSGALPALGGEAGLKPNGTPRVGHWVALAENSAHGPQDGDDYAHVFYEFSSTRGIRLFIRTADGGQRDITTEPEWQSRRKAALERLRQKRRSDYVQSHPEMDAVLRDGVAAGVLKPGMTTEQVRACLGDAVSERRTLAREGLVEEWRYSITPLETTGELSTLEGEDACGKGQFLARGRECLLHFLDSVLISWESPEMRRASDGGVGYPH